MPKYHVAMSFAGEDRDYVEKVASRLRAESVDVFYDKYEEADLWGRDLYAHLSEVYQNALFTVFFISEHYTRKAWPNHERRSAQARALTEHREYILPAFFDESIEVPGLLKTIGHVSLVNRTPEQLAELIVQKLRKSGVRLKQSFSYSDRAKVDVDYPLIGGSSVTTIISELQSYDWYEQNPSVAKLAILDWAKVDADDAFVLGRNLYQAACGNARAAVAFLTDLRREAAKLPDDRAMDLVNGMFYEVYFNSKGEFRGHDLKTRHLHNLFALQTVSKFEPAIMFIRRALEPYRSELQVLPSTDPKALSIDISVLKVDPPRVNSIKFAGRELLVPYDDDSIAFGGIWRLAYESFTVRELRQLLAEEWGIPTEQLTIKCHNKINARTKLRLPKRTTVKWPSHG